MTTPVAARNFDPEYLKINPNGTVPSLTSPSLAKPLTESSDIARYIDSLRVGPTALVPASAETKQTVQKLIDLSHAPKIDTSIIILLAQDAAELSGKVNSPWKSFIVNRQVKLDEEHRANPEHPFYGPKAVENSQLHAIYTTPVGPAHEAFFAATREMYKGFAEGVAELEDALVLPYAAGEELTEADLHIGVWLSHAMMGAGTDVTQKEDFGPLERVVGKSVEGFRVGPKIKEWWGRVIVRDAFEKVFPVLH